ncbi:MAG: XisI protein [Byssovorax sp.]
MDTRAADRDVIEKVLAEYAAIPWAHGEVKSQTVFDRASDHYLIMLVGTDNRRRVHGCLVHVDIVEGDVVIQRDGTERGMATLLASSGIAPERIVLAFHPTRAYRYSELLDAA